MMDTDSDALNPYRASSHTANGNGVATNQAGNRGVRIYLCCHLLAVIGATIASLIDTRVLQPTGLTAVVLLPMQWIGMLGIVLLMAAPFASLWILIQVVLDQRRWFWALAAELCLWAAHFYALLPSVK